MRLHRFYIDQIIGHNTHLTTSLETLLHQWMKVFRLREGDEIVIFDGTGVEFHARFTELHKAKAVLEIIGEAKNAYVPTKEVYLFAAIIKKDNFEWIVEKATEIGVSHIVPLLCERTEKKDVNHERITKIAVEAAEQSGRGTVPHIYKPVTLIDSLNIFKDVESVVCDFNGETFQSAVAHKDRVGIYIGPEGGWSDAERELFVSQNVKSVSLGEQVLRAETAAISACALLLL